MRQTTSVLYFAIDSLIPLRGKPLAGLDELMAALDHAGIPTVWISSRTRLQLDDPRRKIGHHHPFIAEEGCGAYLPEDYFHLRPEKTVRLGRFMCIPVADRQPAAMEVLEELSKAADIEAVPLRSLSRRELSQNSGLPPRDAELLRQRDFDELFFLAGTSEANVARLRDEAKTRKVQLRQHGALWSLAIGPSVQRCARELGRLYERALRYHPATVAIATKHEASALFPACDRRILLTEPAEAHREDSGGGPVAATPTREISLRNPTDSWRELLDYVSSGRS